MKTEGLVPNSPIVAQPAWVHHAGMSQDTANTLDAAAIAHLQQWVGKSEELHDDITAAPLRGLSATLDRDDAQPAKGTPVPPLGH